MNGCIRCLILKISLVFDFISGEKRDKWQALTKKMEPSQKQCQSSSIQCAGIRYPRRSEPPLPPPPAPIQSFHWWPSGQFSMGCFMVKQGICPTWQHTKASERQIFNWTTSELQRQHRPFSRVYVFNFLLNAQCTFLCHFWAVTV